MATCALDVHPIVLPASEHCSFAPQTDLPGWGWPKRVEGRLAGCFESLRKERKPSGPSKGSLTWRSRSSVTPHWTCHGRNSSDYSPSTMPIIYPFPGDRGPSPRVIVNDEKPLTAVFGKRTPPRRSSNQDPANACGHRRNQPKSSNSQKARLTRSATNPCKHLKPPKINGHYPHRATVVRFTSWKRNARHACDIEERMEKRQATKGTRLPVSLFARCNCKQWEPCAEAFPGLTPHQRPE